MNRIEEYYEVACKFLALPDMARYMLGINFYSITFNVFIADEDLAARQIFKTATANHVKWREFRSLVNTFTETRSRKNVRYLH